MPSDLHSCPNCGGEEFSIILTRVHFGIIQPGNEDVHPYFESHKRGDNTGTSPSCLDDDQNDIVFCVECEKEFAVTSDGLEPSSKEEMVAVPREELETVLQFVKGDPALDSAPSYSDIPDAIERVDDALYS